MNLNPYFIPHIKTNSKWIIHLNVKAESTRLVEENIGVYLHELRLDNSFLDMTPKPEATKEKLDKLDVIKLKNSFASKDTIKK